MWKGVLIGSGAAICRSPPLAGSAGAVITPLVGWPNSVLAGDLTLVVSLAQGSIIYDMTALHVLNAEK